ncbi:MAG TPA: alpha/beta hydrolase [Gemmatimonadales bacterium]|jgi:pimeloyl-ACP methyl ester carboxylesterase
MLLSWIAAATLAVPLADSTARRIALAPAESLQVTIEGPATGPAVVIVPGIVSPAYAFRRILPPLAEAGMRVIVIEPLGMGKSSRPGNADYSLASQAQRVAAVLDTLAVSNAVVMGHAMGTAISLRLAVARPELVRGLLLVEGGALESAAVPGVRKALKFAFFVRLFVGRGRIRKELRKGLIACSGDTSWVTEETIDNYTAGPAGDVGAVLRALKGMQRAVEPDSITPRLASLGIPVHLLVGGAAHEGGISTGRIRALEHRIHDFWMTTVIGAGLHIHEEQPEVVVRGLLDLVREEHARAP